MFEDVFPDGVERVAEFDTEREAIEFAIETIARVGFEAEQRGEPIPRQKMAAEYLPLIKRLKEIAPNSHFVKSHDAFLAEREKLTN